MDIYTIARSDYNLYSTLVSIYPQRGFGRAHIHNGPSVRIRISSEPQPSPQTTHCSHKQDETGLSLPWTQ